MIEQTKLSDLYIASKYMTTLIQSSFTLIYVYFVLFNVKIILENHKVILF